MCDCAVRHFVARTYKALPAALAAMGLQCSAHESGIIAEGRNEDLACRKMQRQPQRARDRGQDCGNRLFGLARQSRQSIHIFSLAMHRCPLFQGRRPPKFRLAPLTVWVRTICRDLCHYFTFTRPSRESQNQGTAATPAAGTNH